MVIALDEGVTRQADAGVARYVRGLKAALLQRPDLHVVGIGGGALERRGTLRKRVVTLRQDLWWYPLRGRSVARGLRASVYHCPGHRAPVTRARPPLVLTIHDMTCLRFPETLTRWARTYERATLRRMARAADRLIVPSSDTANDLSLLLGVQEDRIRVIPLGVDDIFFSAAETGEPAAQPPYVLFVGTPQPRKNLPRLASAIRLLRSRGFAEKLVIAGSGGWGEALTGIQPGNDVVLLGRVGDAELQRLYAHASCLAIPSLHEGFGLPAVEAMAVGTPVVAAAAGALPEITAGAAILVDPRDVESIAQGIEQAIQSRPQLVAAGRARAAALTWSAAAEQTARVYAELA